MDIIGCIDVLTFSTLDGQVPTHKFQNFSFSPIFRSFLIFFFFLRFLKDMLYIIVLTIITWLLLLDKEQANISIVGLFIFPLLSSFQFVCLHFTTVSILSINSVKNSKNLLLIQLYYYYSHPLFFFSDFKLGIHTELIGKLWWPIEFVFNTPSHHRVHHGRNAKYIDKNFGGTLIIFDRIFGTFQAEEETPVYGITHSLDSCNIHSFIQLVNQSINHSIF